MRLLSRSKRLFARPHLRLIALLGVIVPRRLRADWRQEWVVDEAFARRFLNGASKVGRRFRIAAASDAPELILSH